MEETLKMMKSILTGKEGKVNEKELINEYQRGLYPNILAYFFTSNIKMIYLINKLYPLLDEEDQASFCLQEIDKCLRNFDSTNNVKFITYFSICYKNRLRMETEQLMCYKRKGIVNYVVIDEKSSLYVVDDYFAENDILEEYPLTRKEKKQCRLLYSGYTLKEIAGVFKQTTAAIYKRNQQIKQKILNYNINFN